MRGHHGKLFFAPTDLSRFLACRRLTSLDRAVKLGETSPPPVFEDPRRDALAEAGQEHEARMLERYRIEGHTIETVDASGGFAEQSERTLDAMRRGREVIYQGKLGRGTWGGYPDFLVRVPRPSALGDWSYEVVDAKLATVAKADAVLQIAVYSWFLEEAQGTAPVEMHLALGGAGDREPFRVADFAAFERALRRQFEGHCADPGPTYPEPVDLCPRCDWNQVCRDRRRADDHLSLVAGASRHQRRRLEDRGITTLAALGRIALPLDPPLDGVQPASLQRIHRQAKAQLTGRESGRPFRELIAPPEEGRGLLALPEPSDGDLFFDIESSRPTADGGLEYLFGFVDRDGHYDDRWAFDRGGEREVFESFMDLLAERRERFGDLHVYHYGGYETGALKRLMSRYATREDAMDVLLRHQVFVDLLQVVRQGLVASVESYSIKEMERFYGFVRRQDLIESIRARARMDAALDAGDRAEPGDLEVIRRYNREDCLSTLALHDWLEDLRRELTGEIGPRSRPTVEIGPEKEQEQSEAAARVEHLGIRLTSDCPADESEARQLLRYLLDYHRREDKSAWWEFFHLCGLDAEQLFEERTTLGGLAFEAEIGPEKQSVLHRYRFPPQDHGIDVGTSVRDPATGASPGEVFGMTDDALVLKRSRQKVQQPHPGALVPVDILPTRTMRDSLFRLGELVAEDGFPDDSPRRAAFDLVRRVPPRNGAGGASLVRPGEDLVAAARRLAVALDREVLPVQGPPGSGKTYLGARVITALLAAGRRVGVTAQSHQVITNLLNEVCAAADGEAVTLRGVQIAPHTGCTDPRFEVKTGSGNAIAAVEDPEVRVIAGTTWVWAREDMQDAVDVLVVDEAGQFSLAAALASAPAAGSLVLLGDPRQLDQVTQGIHPEGSSASALGHLLAGEKTIPRSRGLFLDHTWRMHPGIGRFTSELFYEDRLRSRPGLEQQTITGGPLPGAGLRFVPVAHDGNQRESPEEADRIGSLVAGMLDAASWTDAHGTTRRITPEDILIVAPYNAQVDLLARVLDGRARVGTVDKFQGQEAPVVFYSLATSTPDAAPRGMDFLYSLNRLNVATSRARCLAAVVASPELFFPECKTPHQMRLANAFCRFRELADVVR